LVSENIFWASDVLLVPMIPTTLSARTLDQLLAFLKDHGRFGELRVLPLFSMVDRRKRLHLDLIERLPEQYSDLLETHIPYASDVERMGVHRRPLPTYAPSGAAATAYRALWDGIKRRL